MKKIMKSIKIAFTILVMSSLNFACHSSSQEAVAPIDADVTTASAATEANPTGIVTLRLGFDRSTFGGTATREIISNRNENIKDNIIGVLEDNLSSIKMEHKSNSSKKTLYVKIFNGRNQSGDFKTFSIKRGETKIFDVPDSFGDKASSFSIYYTKD